MIFIKLNLLNAAKPSNGSDIFHGLNSKHILDTYLVQWIHLIQIMENSSLNQIDKFKVN